MNSFERISWSTVINSSIALIGVYFVWNGIDAGYLSGLLESTLNIPFGSEIAAENITANDSWEQAIEVANK